MLIPKKTKPGIPVEKHTYNRILGVRLCLLALRGGLDSAALVRSGSIPTEEESHLSEGIGPPYVAVSTLFVTAASTDTLTGPISGVAVVPALPVPKVTPTIIPFSKNNLTNSTK